MLDKSSYNLFIGKLSINRIILCLVGVLSGTAKITYGINVFGYIYTYALLQNNFSYLMCIAPVAGYILKGDLRTAFFYLLATFFLCLFNFFGQNIKKKNVRKTVCCVILCFTETLRCLSGGFFTYYIFIIILEIILTYFLSDYYELFAGYFSSSKPRKTISKKELCAVVTVLFVALSSISGAEFFYGIKPIGIISVYIILCMSTVFDVSTTTSAGTLLGLICSLHQSFMLYSVGSYSISAFFASLSKGYKKAGIISAFLISNAVITFYVNGSEEVLINIYEIFLGSILFLFTPSKKIEAFKNRIRVLNPEKSQTELKRVEFMRETAFNNLKQISTAVEALSKALAKKHTGNKVTNESLITEIKRRTCSLCNNFSVCEKARSEFVDKTINSMIEAIKKRGFCAEYDLPYSYKNFCINVSKMVLETNKVYEIFRINTVWESKISESREVIKEQLLNVSDSIDSFAEDFTKSYTFELDLEKALITLLDKMGVNVTSVTISKDINGKFSVKIGIRHSGKRKTGELLIVAAANKILNKNMKVTDSYIKDDSCLYQLSEDETYKVSTAVSKIRAGNNEVSGDSYAIIKPENGKCIVALSDGMGVGENAQEKSMETVKLLDLFINSGIRKENAVKLINSVLVLKSFDESFATLDILVTDLYSGECEFIKTGGVCSFIVRENSIETVEGFSLPTGILPEIKYENKKVRLKHQDVVVLMSDGVSDSFSGKDEIFEAIGCSASNNLKEFADGIMKAAYNKANKRSDDMTVLVVKLTEK